MNTLTRCPACGNEYSSDDASQMIKHIEKHTNSERAAALIRELGNAAIQSYRIANEKTRFDAESTATREDKAIANLWHALTGAMPTRDEINSCGH